MQGGLLHSFWWAHGENGLLTGQPGVELWAPTYNCFFWAHLVYSRPIVLGKLFKRYEVDSPKVSPKNAGDPEICIRLFFGVGFSLTISLTYSLYR